MACKHGKGLNCRICYDQTYGLDWAKGKDTTVVQKVDFIDIEGSAPKAAYDLMADRKAVEASVKFMGCIEAGGRIHKLTKLLIDDPYLSCAEHRIGWAMQSEFRDLGEETITKVVTYVSLFK